ncbi:hypothetical protein I2W78_13730 [Streptomyces spinoverrucosus]|uniref:hypothetical protein n=1 Tax=Streptomyces spinoverrucosus TaxID=284043 RepID=UPI0018C3A66D|nr:hypothetical protein [Streptomyces spinoverrucosus]MBG0852873.1 hypothetical protein [Streptomyces spinoverrucosus]
MNNARLLTGWSVAGLLLLLPTVAVAWVAVLATERGSRCLTYGEQCSTIPSGVLHAFFWAALALGALALAWPRARWQYARLGAVLVQWGAQLTLGSLILSGA